MREECKRGKWVFRDGQWSKGSAGPELQPEHMRGLPGEWLTKEEAHPDNIHALDPPHIVESLVEEHVKKIAAADAKDDAETTVKKLKCAQPGENVPLSQWEIDVVRFRVLWSLVTAALRMKQAGCAAPILDIKHLRFPENNVNIYELHEGNPPPVGELAKHERGFSLEIDPLCWPPTIVALLEARGIVPPDIASLTRECNRRIIT